MFEFSNGHATTIKSYGEFATHLDLKKHEELDLQLRMEDIWFTQLLMEDIWFKKK